MSVIKVNGWRWSCSCCAASGMARLKKDATKAEKAHRLLHAPITMTVTSSPLWTFSTWTGGYATNQ